jgi:N-acetylglucosamine kinase-like BadF-type ATPase
MNQFSIFLGVDGGQSSTTALIGDETGRVLGSGIGGPCNHVGAAEGRQKFVRAIEECVSTACRAAGLDSPEVRFASACLGFSGGPEDKQPILAEILRTERLLVTTDALIALAGATAGEPGIITIAGTGSIAFGRNAQGQTARAGGWGYIFGDEGGAFGLTREALRAALRAEEGWGPPTTLRARLLEAAGAASANELLHRFYTTEFPRPHIASFARLVDEAAQQGDSVAREILFEAARELAALADAVRRQLFQPGEPARVALIGGVFRSQMLRERFCALVEIEEGNRCGPPVYGPAAGALIEAYRAAGLSPQLSQVPEFKS